MSERSSNSFWVGIGLIAGFLLAIGLLFSPLNRYLAWLSPTTLGAAENPPAESDLHAGHDHGDHDDHGDLHSIELSENGLKNIGYRPLVIAPQDYDKKLSLPAIVVERPGRSQLHIVAPLTGEVTKIHAVSGEAIAAEQPLFDLRLKQEELVDAQRAFLRTAESLDVVNREIARLKQLEEGVIAGRRILEQQYEKQKLEASLHAERQALLLHGISEEQIEEILKSRRLFRDLTVRAPAHSHDQEICDLDHPLLIQQLAVSQGEQVDTGSELAILADHCELHIQAQAFEDDADAIRQAAKEGRQVEARLLSVNSPATVISNLEILYVSDRVDPQSRAFRVFLRLPNEVVHDKTTATGKRYTEWRYKPGQRMRISVPMETWEDQIVLPTTAVVDDGAESYVYRQNGDHFEQVSVHVLHQDQDSAVIANDGSLFRDDVVAGIGAYQMHLALKNKACGGIDPHAGHTH